MRNYKYTLKYLKRIFINLFTTVTGQNHDSGFWTVFGGTTLFLNEEENVTYLITNPKNSVLMLIYILFVLNILY